MSDSPTGRTRVEGDRAVIEAFIARYNDLTGATYASMDWPEDRERKEPVIDCLSSSPGPGPPSSTPTAGS